MSIGRKNNINYKFPRVDLSSLLQLAERSPPDNKDVFKKDFGRISGFFGAPLTDYQEGAIHTLLQFYDPPLRCFTFPDYLLAPTLEEYSNMLDIPIKHQEPFHISMGTSSSYQIAATLYLSKSEVEANLKIKSSLSGFLLNFLLKKAHMSADKESWGDFNSLLACCIYGTMLFPNVVDFVDINAIRIFALRNLVPTLLGDVYHSVHTRNHKGKGGLVWCCAPLLYVWFRSHLPTKGAFVETRDYLRWSERLMGLTSQDIVWYELSLKRRENLEIICSCGEFPNVPLLGIRGSINYNPMLLRRQLGYALKGSPVDKEVPESFFYTMGDDVEMMRRVVRAWNHIRCKGKLHFGRRDCFSYSPYVAWITDRVKKVWLPFPKGELLYPQEPEHPDLVSKSHFDQIALMNKNLRQEKEEMIMQVYAARHEKMKMAHKMKAKNELIKDFRLSVNDGVKKKSRVEVGGESSFEVFEDQKKVLHPKIWPLLFPNWLAIHP